MSAWIPKETDTRALIRLRLYVAGDSPNSVTALANLHSVLRAHPDRQIKLEVIDVVREPEGGVRDGVLVTPMLVKVEPLPERRVLGNLRDRAVLLGALGLDRAPRD